MHKQNEYIMYLELETVFWFGQYRGTPEALYFCRFLHGVHLPANQRRLPPLPTDPIGWDVYAM